MTASNRNILIVASLLIVGAIMYFFGDIVAYVILAWVLSMIGQPVMDFLKRFMNRNLAALVTLLGFLVVFTGLVWVFVPTIVQQTKNLAGIDYTSLANSLEEPVNDWNNWLIEKGFVEGEIITESDSLAVDDTNNTTNDSIIKEPDPISAELIRIDTFFQNDSTSVSQLALLINVNNLHHKEEPDVQEDETKVKESDSFADRVKKNIYNFINPARIPQVFGSLISVLGNFMIAIMSIFFISFFFLREEGLFTSTMSALVPTGYEERTSSAIDQTSKLLIRYFVGVASQVTIITIFVSLALSLFGIKNALLIGFFVALMNVIPYIGPIIGATFGVMITISSNLNLSFYSELLPLLLIVIGVIAVMQLLDNLILQPQIFSTSVKAHPLEIFICVLVGAKIGGILGMVLAIPVYTVLRVIAKVFLSEFKLVQKITGGL